jgi:hypothetical protein
MFLGFWILITPSGRYPDDIYTLAHVRYIQNNGNIGTADVPSLSYLNWPGLPILGVIFSDILSTDIFLTRVLILLVVIVLLPLLFYLLCRNSSLSKKMAALAAVLFIIGDADLARSINFAPVMLGAVLFMLFLILWKKHFSAKSNLYVPVLMLLFVTLTISYFITGVCLLVITFVTLLGQVKISRKKIRPTNLVFPLSLVLVLFIWNINWAANQVLSSFDKIMVSIQTYKLAFILNSAGSGIEHVPLWANFTQFFWLFLIYGAGSIIAVMMLVRKKFRVSHLVDITGFLAVALFSIIIYFFSPQGSQFQRFLMYAPFFTIPILLLFISSLPKKRTIILVLIVLIATLSFPTFLTENKHVSTYSFPNSQNKAFEFVQTSSDSGLLQIYSQGIITWTIRLYLPQAQLISEPVFFENQSNIWGELIVVHERFENSSNPLRIFIMSNQIEQFVLTNYPYTSKIDANEQVLRQSLKLDNRVYDNSYSQFYSP